MPYSAIQVANYILHLAGTKGQSLTPMQLLKLVYIAEGWHQKFYSLALIDEPIQAWKYGPVIPSLYFAIRNFGADAIEGLIRDPQDGTFPNLPADAEQAQMVVEQVYKVYGHLTGTELSRISHSPESPWSIVTKQGADIGRNKVIPAEELRTYFSKVYDQALMVNDA
jgi:uncharacterized phage-associated protein